MAPRLLFAAKHHSAPFSLPRFALACLLAALCALSAPAPARADDLTALDDQITDLMTERNLPSVSVVLVRHGEVVFDRAYGYANRERRIPATTDTPYSLASVSKPFTATALMILQQRGLIDLDAPINRYLGADQLTTHVGDPDAVTVRRVANHTSGLPPHHHFFYEDESARRPSMSESIRQFGVIMSTPGAHFLYSNFGYGLLEYTIERQSGRSYAQVLQDELFSPLHMTNSSGLPDRRLLRTAAVRYGNNGRPIPGYDFDHRGASSVYASAHDLARFGAFFLGDADARPELLTAESRAELTHADPAPARDGQEVYGLGINVRRAGGRLIYSHSGSMPGVATTLTLLPEQDAVIVILINSSAYGAMDALSAIRDRAINILADGAFNPATPALPAGSPLDGVWHGAITANQAEIPFTLSVQHGAVTASLGAGGATQEGAFMGLQDGVYAFAFRTIQIPTPEATRYRHGLLLRIEPRDGRLTGSATAYGAQQPDRMGSALSYWIELQRTQ